MNSTLSFKGEFIKTAKVIHLLLTSLTIIAQSRTREEQAFFFSGIHKNGKTF